MNKQLLLEFVNEHDRRYFKVIKHFYNGKLAPHPTICNDCGREMYDIIHFRNASTICDNPDGPCACGAWHKPEEFINR